MSEPFNKSEFLTDLERRRNLVTADEGCITIHGPFEYEIELARCATAVAILQWVRHLSEKTWVTTEMIERFVDVASGRIGLDIDSIHA
jgi:hypothetical protein